MMKKSALIIGMVLAGTAGLAVAADSLYVNAKGNVGVGGQPYDAAGQNLPKLHSIISDPSVTFPLVFQGEATATKNALFRFQTVVNGSPHYIDFNKIGEEFRLNIEDADGWELKLEKSGDLTIKGDYINGNGQTLAGLSEQLELKNEAIAGLKMQVEGLTAALVANSEKMEVMNVKFDARTREMEMLIKVLAEERSPMSRKAHYIP